MKKKNILAILILLIFVIVVASFLIDRPEKKTEKRETSLSYIKPRDPKFEEEPEFKESSDYQLKRVQLGDKVERAEGIIYKDEKLYILDSQKSQIVVLDKTYHLINKIGKMGNSILEFKEPTGITFDGEGNIYILDTGNRRVQVLDKNLKFLKEIKYKMKTNAPDSYYDHIAIDKENNIYLSGDVLENPGIAVLDKSGKQFHIYDYFIGSIFSKEGEIYAVNFGDLVSESGEKDGFGSQTGQNFLLKIENNKLKKVYELPYGISTRSFLIDDKKNIIVDSALFSTVTFIDMKGNYQFSLKQYPENIKQRTSHICLVDDKILLTNSIDGKLVEYSPKK